MRCGRRSTLSSSPKTTRQSVRLSYKGGHAALFAVLGAVLLLAAPAEAARLRTVTKLKATANGRERPADVEGPGDAARPATRSAAPACSARVARNATSYTDRKAKAGKAYRYSVRPCRAQPLRHRPHGALHAARAPSMPGAADAAGARAARRRVRRQPGDRRLPGLPEGQRVEHRRLAGARRHVARLHRLARLDGRCGRTSAATASTASRT